MFLTFILLFALVKLHRQDQGVYNSRVLEFPMWLGSMCGQSETAILVYRRLLWIGSSPWLGLRSLLWIISRLVSMLAPRFGALDSGGTGLQSTAPLVRRASCRRKPEHPWPWRWRCIERTSSVPLAPTMLAHITAPSSSLAISVSFASQEAALDSWS